MALPKGVRIISGRQARAARAVLGLSVGKLAGSSGVSETSIRRIESGQDAALKVDLIYRLQSHLETQGFTFLWEGEEVGVKWPDGNQ